MKDEMETWMLQTMSLFHLLMQDGTPGICEGKKFAFHLYAHVLGDILCWAGLWLLQVFRDPQ